MQSDGCKMQLKEAECHIHDTEKTLEKTEATLESAIKRIAYVEPKRADLVNRGRRKKLQLFGIREVAKG